MRNVTNLLLQSWYMMLSTAPDLAGIPVYRLDVSNGADPDVYILLRAESGTWEVNNNRFVTSEVIITEIVAKFDIAIDDGKVVEIDDIIARTLFPAPTVSHALPPAAGIKVTDIRRLNQTYLPEDDGAIPRIHRLITRNQHRVFQTI